MKAKQYSYRDFSKLLNDNGYKLMRTKGDHFIYSNGTYTMSVNLKLNMMVARRLIKEFDLKER